MTSTAGRRSVATMLSADVSIALERSFLGRRPRDVVAHLFEGQPVLELPADATFYREGDPPRAFLKLSGLVRLFLRERSGREVTVRYGRPSDVLGTALVIAGRLDVNAQTLSPTILHEIDAGRLADASHDRASPDPDPRSVHMPDPRSR